MKYLDNSLESLKLQDSCLDLAIKENESHVWKNLIRIEQIKKENLRRKDALMRSNMQKVIF